MPSENHRIATLRTQYLADLEALDAVARQLSRTLVDSASARATLRDHIAGGGTVVSVEDLIEPNMRGTLSDALTEFERVRHRSQRSLFRLQQAEGQSMTAIGLTWGISRQLVSRLVNESD
jgi:hypothetical protein